jgi:alkaline phosphatase
MLWLSIECDASGTFQCHDAVHGRTRRQRRTPYAYKMHATTSIDRPATDSNQFKMKYNLLLAGLLHSSSATWILPSARNFIYIVPDGYGPASQTMARDYVSLLQHGENPKAPVSIQLPADQMVIGNVRTKASNNLITDSAASATAFGCGVKTYNNGMWGHPAKIAD